MYLYPKWIRLWHLLNAILVVLLIITGASIRFPGDDMKFIFEFPKAIRWHNTSAILLTLNYIFFIIGNYFTDNGKYYRIPFKHFWSGMGKQLRFYAYEIFKGKKNPFSVSIEQKFNPLQRFSYVIVMYIAMPLVIISGLSLLFPGNNEKEIFGISLTYIKDILHIIAATVLFIFLIIHIYCIFGSKSLSHLREIITGFVESE